MEFTVGDVTRCAGTGHIRIPYQITSGPSGVVETTPEEVMGDPTSNAAELRERALARLRSAVKESGATTWSQIQAAVEGKSFKI